MSQVPVDDRTLQVYEPPRNTQFSVFLDNRVGRMLEFLELLESQSVRTLALSVQDSADYAVNRLLVNKPEVVRRVCKEAKIAFAETEVLVVGLTGGKTLVDLCRMLVQAEVNILYSYSLMVSLRGDAGIVLQTDDLTLTGQVLKRKMFMLMGENDLRGIEDDE